MESNDRPDERHDTLPTDDSSIEIVSENGDLHSSDSEWSIHSAGRGSISESTVSSMDFQKLSVHSKNAKIVHHDGRQFIERRDLDDGGLPYSAEFYLNDELWKLSGEDCFLVSPRRYIAMVSVEGTVDLDGAADFDEVIRILVKHLKLVKVLLDKQLEECNNAKSVLEMILDKLGDESAVDHKRDVMLLRILLQKHSNSLNMNFKHDLRNSSRLSSETKSVLENYVTTTLKLIQRNEILGHLNDSSFSDEFINDALQKALTIHRARLEAICPTALMENFKEFPDDHILNVSPDDMKLFNELTALDQTMFGAVLPMIFSKFLTTAQAMNDEESVDRDPLSNRIFLYICKSLQEVSEQLRAQTKIENALIYSEALGWEVTNLDDESLPPYSKCLRQQLEMLSRLANHFEPGGTFRTSRFPYEFKLFQNMDVIPEPVRIWLCLLDDCMKDLVQADIDKMQMLSCFFKSYVSFIASEEFRSETLECLRRITHDALRSLTDMQSSCQHDRTTSSLDLLEFNDMISSCFDKFLCEHFGNDCEQIQMILRRIIGQAMNKNVASEESTEFSNVFKQLLKDISDIPLEWYVQLPPSENRNLFLRGQFVVPVDNRWKDTEHECLKVVDPEGFVKFYNFLHNGVEIPKHYQLKAIQVLLDKLAAKLGKFRSNKHQLSAMTNMINSIRSSILYLNRQPDYSCFEDFLQDMAESFSNAITERRPLEDFLNTLSLMNNSVVTDTLESHPIDFGETLDPLLDIFQGSISKGLLTNRLKIFATQFNKHITETDHLPREKSINQIVSDVVIKVKPQLATTWTEEFKRNELPEVLAGLSAVWSLIVSKTSRSLEKLVKPSSLQISCILSFFGDKNNNDDDLYKLLYISAQQGKELVIGLTASLLALYGHKVLIACFNSNLTRRNSINLIEVFKSFSIHSNISFGSLEDMAWERSREDYEKYAAYIHECLGIESNANNGNKPEHAPEDEISVLLIEDIEVLLLQNILGQAFKLYVRPTIPGLAMAQEKNKTENLNLDEIYQFIDQSDDPEICKLRAFLNRPQSYTIHNGPYFNKVKYTNRTLFKEYRNEIDGILTFGYIPIPYAHLLKSFPLVFGFTSTPLDVYDELALHVHYDIYHKIGKSNLLQTVPVKFDSKKDFLCVPDGKNWDWMHGIMVAINSAIDRNRSVLVFFNNELKMTEFQSKYTVPLKRLRVTATKDEGAVMVIERNSDLGEDREVHVIQTFFTRDEKEENLIKSQARWSQCSGSYELIVTNKVYMHIPDGNEEDKLTYDLLFKVRGTSYGTNCAFYEESLNNNMKKYEEFKTYYNTFLAT